MGEKPRVVLDTNVYISAFGWGGKPDDCFRLILDEEIDGYVYPDILDEISLVFDYPKFDFTDLEKHRILTVIALACDVVHPANQIHLLEDEADNRVLECAVHADATHVITGDQDLLELGNHESIELSTPAEFLQEM